MEAKMSATIMQVWSNREYWRTAETIPSEIPMIDEMDSDKIVRRSVFGNLAMMSLITGCLLW